MSLHSHTRGNAQASYIALITTIVVLGVAGFRTLGGSFEHAIATDATASAEQRGFASLSTQAGGLSELAHGAIELAEQLRRPIGERLPLEAMPDRAILLTPSPRFSAEQVSRLRDAAHELWQQGDAAARATVSIGDRSVEVGAVPRHRAIDPREAHYMFKSTDHVELKVDIVAKQERRMFDVFDDALDIAFARGLTGTSDAQRLSLMGDDLQFKHFRDAYLPRGMWEVRMHGEETFFKIREGGAERHLSGADIAEELRRAGYEEGAPVVLRVCRSGACISDPQNAAQALSDALDAPVVAASERVSPKPIGRAFVSEDDSAWTAGEWRLFQPTTWGNLPEARRVVIGRGTAPGELGLGSVNDLWKLAPASVDRLEIAGHWRQYYALNEGALDAAHRALTADGRLVLRSPRASDIPGGGLRSTLARHGFEIRRENRATHFYALVRKTASK